MKKRLCLIIALVWILCLSAMPVMAAPSEMVLISGNTYFDQNQNVFAYYVDPVSGQMVYSNVADGMITNRVVNIWPGTNTVIEVYRDGSMVENAGGGSYELAGQYVVMYAGGKVEQQVMTFTIVADITNSVNQYTIPSGFEVTQVTLDGEEIPYERTRVNMVQEGEYDIHYRCIKTDIPYQLKVSVDHTGPQLKLEAVTDGFARGPVDISDAKDAAAISIYHEGEKISRKDVLTESGEYYIELADAAGNKSTYSFTILIYFDGNSWLFFTIALAGVVAVAIYLLHARKHMRVR